MKQSSIGFRLVQRKFAQGVPVPPSHNAPLPPEKKAEPVKEEQRTVYHSRMSARNLLDIVALQNVHRHKQPMVLVERLRVDDIPATSAPVKKRPNAKAKKNMCLRPREKKNQKYPRKRKNKDGIKGPVKKRARFEDNSTTDDDTPLLYLRSPERPAESEAEDRSSTFKRPTDTSIARYRQFQRRRSVTPSPLTIGRGTPAARRSGRRAQPAARGPSPEPPRARLPARPCLLSGKSKKVIRKRIQWNCTDDSIAETALPVEERNGSTSPRGSRSSNGSKSPKSPGVPVKRATRSRSVAASNQFSVETPAPVSTNGPTLLKTSSTQTNGSTSPSESKSPHGSKPAKSPDGPALLKTSSSKRTNGSTSPSESKSPHGSKPAKSPGMSARRTTRSRSVAASHHSVGSPASVTTDDEEILPKAALPTEETNGTTSTRGSKSPKTPGMSARRTTRSRSVAASHHSVGSPASVTTDDEEILPKAALPTEETNGTTSTRGSKSPKTPGMSARRTTRSRSVAASHHSVGSPDSVTTDDEEILPKAALPTEETNGTTSTRGSKSPKTPGMSARRTTRSRSVAASHHSVGSSASVTTDDEEILPKAALPTEETNGTTSTRGSKSPKTPGSAAKRATRARSVAASAYYAAETPVPVPAAPKPKRSCPSAAYSSVQEVVLAATAQCPRLAGRCHACRGCGVVAKILQLTELVRAEGVNPAAVYDFDTELDEAMCPSLSCLRVRRRLARAAGDHLYLDLLPPDMPQLIQILCKKTDRRLVSAVSVVDRDVVAADQPTLFEREGLLDQLLECMGRRAQAPPSGEPAASVNEPDDDDAEPDDAGLPPGAVVDAPVFRPTAEEFTDPIAYYTKIQPLAAKYGLCRIVPPAGFDPPCNLSDHIRFAVIYQYISKLYNRWGPVARELAAIKAHLRTQSVVFARAPLLDGREVNLPKLYHSVERHGGPTKVIQKKRWGRVAEEMKLNKLQNPERKLDQIYMRYLLPYATLSNQERQDKMTDVEKYWAAKYQKMLARARNPLHRQKRLLGESESSESSDDGDTAGALLEAEDCIVQGRTMNLATFKKIASSLMEAQFAGGRPDTAAVERAYWRAVLLGTEHVVANTASLDTGDEGHGFPKDGTHPWNLKMLANNPGNVLRFLGPVLGVTVPTLHLSMLFSTSCWHRDPHGLPWVEYMHSGPDKIWYGIPSSQSGNFRRAVETLCPAYCQNKSIWLASDIAMIPPEVLGERGVALARAEQRPGEYVMVFPEAHSCSVTTGFSVSESVYFAPSGWLDSVQKLFQELRNSCEPTMFSLEQLLLSGAAAAGARGPPAALAGPLAALLRAELDHRAALARRGVTVQIRDAPNTQSRGWHARAADECEYCRASLYLSKVVGVTARRTPLCPEHARRLLEARKYRHVDATTLELHSAHSTAALQALLARLEP